VSNAPVGSITYGQKSGVEYEYELCLKCHSGWSASGDSRDIASEVDTRNASFHAIEGEATASDVIPGTFESGWTNDSILYCTTCHGNSTASQPVGPHSSAFSPLLKKRYSGVLPSSTEQVCFTCHRYDVYYNGDVDLVDTTEWVPRRGEQGVHRPLA